MPLTILSTSSPPPSIPQHSHRRHYKQCIKPFKHSISLLRSRVQSGRMADARKVFDEMPERTPVAWTILIDGYIRLGPCIESLSLLCKMVNELSFINLKPDPFAVSVGLKACTRVGSLDFGRELHCSAVKLGYMEDLFVVNALVAMYSACGFLCCARRVFQRILKPDSVSWSSMISGLVKNGNEIEAARLFVEMARTGLGFDEYVVSVGLKAFADQNCTGLGVQVHCHAIKMGLNSSFVYNSLMEYYGRIGELASMRKVFDQTSKKDLVSWNIIISCYAQAIGCKEALMVFSSLMLEGSSKCDDFTLGSILQAVTRLGALNHGKQIHGYVIRTGFASNSYVTSALLDMYVNCSNQDAVSFKLLRHLWSLKVELDEFIAASIFKSCALHENLEAGKMFHSYAFKFGMEMDPCMTSSLIDMYAKCGELDACLRIFVGIQSPDTVAWSAIIAAQCWNSQFPEALSLFRKMQSAGVRANEFTYTSAIVACTCVGDLQSGIEIHSNIIRHGYGLNPSVVNTLINFYVGLGQCQVAFKLSSLIPIENIPWASLIQAFGKTEEHEKTMKAFHKIQQAYGHLDHKTACIVLNSFVTPIFLNAGIQAHAYIIKRGLLTDLSTSNSLINMYSRCGELDSAVDAFNRLPEKNSSSWTSIISAYVDHDHPSEAISQFVRMIRKGKFPNSSTFLNVLKAYGQMGLVDEAFRVFTSMVEMHKIDPSAEIYSSMVEVLSSAGMFKEAEHFIESVIPFKPSVSVWRTLLSSCQSHGNIRVAKLAEGKIGELESNNLTTNLLLKQSLLQSNRSTASDLEVKTLLLGSSWIESRGNVIEFASGQIVVEQVSAKFMEVAKKMEESGYVTDKYHWLHNLEEDNRKSSQHTELMALTYGLVSLPEGIPIRVFKITRMCGECHSACKFISALLGRDIFIKDSCKFHHFIDGVCSCKDKW